jgi:hypothetical protein
LARSLCSKKQNLDLYTSGPSANKTITLEGHEVERPLRRATRTAASAASFSIARDISLRA